MNNSIIIKIISTRKPEVFFIIEHKNYKTILSEICIAEMLVNKAISLVPATTIIEKYFKHVEIIREADRATYYEFKTN